ncbi:MAG: 3-dehydroquinate synthase/shikimate kinase / 3-dehydroquinate synthase [Pelagibacterales bacterium]|nr:3-dehydroquinate synthase/shikimate kinase / 3-dehydroquinate synthase [Pelagibacterales bacterium]
MIFNKLKIKTKNFSYSLIIGSNLINKLSKILKDNSINYNKCLIVIDKRVPKKLVKKINISLTKNKYFISFRSSEKNKNQLSVNKILDVLLKKNFNRNDCIISVGGGITGDVSGFAASIFKRGIKFINVPTTLLSQVDSSIGGKTGINTKYGKNLIGSFYQPSLVISDINFLKSLPKREITCGYAEILKHSLIASKKFFLFLERYGDKILKLESPFIQKAIYNSCLIKKKIVELDESEKNLRKILNFAHTFAHSYEATKGYSKKLNHGEAVLLGIASASNFAYKNGVLAKKEFELIINHLIKLNLPRKINIFFSKKNISKIVFFMHKDKKNNNKNINLILLRKIGKVNLNSYYSGKILKNFFKKELIN